MRGGGGGLRKIVHQGGIRRVGPILSVCDTFGNPVQQCWRKDVARERIPDVSGARSDQACGRIHLPRPRGARAKGIVNLPTQDRPSEGIRLTRRPSQQCREIATSFCSGRHRARKCYRRRLSQAFIVGKEIGFVLANWTADRDTKLITMEVGLSSAVKEVSRIQAAVAVKLVSITVECVRTRLGHNVDYVAAAPPILRGERIGLNLEFLYVVHGRN